MKIYIAALLLLLAVPGAAIAQADAVNGVWLNEEKDAKVQVYRNGDKFFGKLIWMAHPLEDDGKTPRRDAKNTNSALRSRPLLNLVILTGFAYDADDKEWEDGKIYDPKSGKTYSSKMKLKGNTLEIRGYVGAPMFGRTTSWTRSQ
ncbi:DUF2147 domain-containing protein [Chitinophaga sp.]|uniref:DUF2147 domain-containing protein n=1 Tax=Chitinophaga sp. TaxID=1869181 RepID=UPI002609379A|nr:DUF2147 domain-containing protein [uncultured Chitinophaga sp.]